MKASTRRHTVVSNGITEASKQALFHAAHDIKGEAATFGYPAVASAADNLCRLIALSSDVTRIPMKLIDQHFDAVRAIHREYARSDAEELAARLTGRLREVTDDTTSRATGPQCLSKSGGHHWCRSSRPSSPAAT